MISAGRATQPRALGRLSVAVVQGGPSNEAEVSRASAVAVARALEQVGHRAVRLEVDAFLAESLRGGGYDVVFPVAHGAVGEDGSLQGLLEVLGLPYVGSGVLASAIAMDKRVARGVFEGAGLPVAKGMALARGDARAAAEQARRSLGPAVVVKPSSHGSAIGVSRLENGASTAEVVRALEAVWAIDEFAIVERFAQGRDVTCGVLDLGAAAALPPIEILTPHDPFYTFEARYAPGRSLHVCPTELAPEVVERIQRIAVAAHGAAGCRDLSRVDFIVGDGDATPRVGGGGSPLGNANVFITLLEVNTSPGMTATSLYPDAAAAHGLPMPSLCDALVCHAHARGPTPRLEARPLPR